MLLFFFRSPCWTDNLQTAAAALNISLGPTTLRWERGVGLFHSYIALPLERIDPLTLQLKYILLITKHRGKYLRHIITFSCTVFITVNGQQGSRRGGAYPYYLWKRFLPRHVPVRDQERY